jgi:hypothetical protein
VDPKILRQHAGDCDRMTNECPDLFTRDALRELAIEFRRAAEALESSAKLHDHRPRRGSTGPSAARLGPAPKAAHREKAQSGRRRRASSSAR